MASGCVSASFVVPVTGGNYAPERLWLGSNGTDNTRDILDIVTAFFTTAVATAVLELWLLKAGGAPATDADYFYSGTSAVATTPNGVSVQLAGWPNGQIRVKSGGTSGTAVVSAGWGRWTK